jgi:hypothetical protein
VGHILTAIPRLLVLGAPLCLPCHPRGPVDHREQVAHSRILARGGSPTGATRFWSSPADLRVGPATLLAAADHLAAAPGAGPARGLVVDLALRSARVRKSTRGFVVLFAGLSAFSSLPWFPGQIMPDIFTSLVILLSFVVFWGAGQLMRWEWRVVGALLVVAIGSHVSHFPIYGLLVGAGLAGRALVARRWRARCTPGSAPTGEGRKSLTARSRQVRAGFSCSTRSRDPTHLQLVDVNRASRVRQVHRDYIALPRLRWDKAGQV